MPVYALGDLVPDIHPDAYVHPDATVIGNVRIGAEASIWPQAVLRGDHGLIEVGNRTNVQDGSVIHAGDDMPTVLGSDVTIGHTVHLEGCTVEPWALVGSGAIVLHRCVIRSHAIVAAGAVVPNDTEVPSRAMALGVPCTIKPDRADPDMIREAAEFYAGNGRHFRENLRRIS